jgi:hypothetical protein
MVSPIDRWSVHHNRRIGAMPKMSAESAAQVLDLASGVDRRGDLAGYVVSFVTVREDSDLAPLLRGLPDDMCQCPHWGYMFRGRQTVRYQDHEEVLEAGDAFYMPPGHAQPQVPGVSSLS